jgi:hypothetical protein
MAKLANTAPQTWELTVSKPLIGTCYSFDWVLDDPSPEFNDLAQEASRFRFRLLMHRHQRLAGDPGLQSIRQCFRELHSELREMFSPPPGELFEVSVMTYDEWNRVLLPVEGMVGEDEFPPDLWNTAIPFGLGLAGSLPPVPWSTQRGNIFQDKSNAHGSINGKSLSERVSKILRVFVWYTRRARHLTKKPDSSHLNPIEWRVK